MQQIHKEFQNFMSNLILKFSKLDISIDNYIIDHVGYRAATLDDYKELFDKFKRASVLYTIKHYHDRSFHLFVLKQPLKYKNISIPYLEFAQPGGSDKYDRGFQHIEILSNKAIESLFLNKTEIKKLLFEDKYGEETYLKWPDKTALKVSKRTIITKSLLDDNPKIIINE